MISDLYMIPGPISALTKFSALESLHYSMAYCVSDVSLWLRASIAPLYNPYVMPDVVMLESDKGILNRFIGFISENHCCTA